jgi:hypothetical protein
MGYPNRYALQNEFDENDINLIAHTSQFLGDGLHLKWGGGVADNS